MPTKKRKPRAKAKPKRKPQCGRGRKTNIAKKTAKYLGYGALGFLALQAGLTGLHAGGLLYQKAYPPQPIKFVL